VPVIFSTSSGTLASKGSVLRTNASGQAFDRLTLLDDSDQATVTVTSGQISETVEVVRGDFGEPLIDSVSPATGTRGASLSVTLTGQNFQQGATASFGEGIGIDDVVLAIQRGNVDLPVGTLNAPTRAYTLVSDAQLINAAAYGPMVVTYRNGAPVRIQDLGVAVDSVENTRVASWFSGKRAVILGVQRQPGANVVQVVDSIKRFADFASRFRLIKLDVFSTDPSIRIGAHPANSDWHHCSVVLSSSFSCAMSRPR
jgi:hypothetical protein